MAGEGAGPGVWAGPSGVGVVCVWFVGLGVASEWGAWPEVGVA